MLTEYWSVFAGQKHRIAKKDGDLDFSILLLWHTIGHGNLGVDALARSNIALLRSAAARAGVTPRFITTGFDQDRLGGSLPDDVTSGPKPQLKRILGRGSAFRQAVAASNLVVDIGEGDSFTDIYGVRRYALQMGTKVATLLSGRPLVLAPQTIGPFDQFARRFGAARVMNRATAVFVRDGLSASYLRELGVKAPTGEFTDVAFALPFEPAPRRGDRVRVGLNVSGLLYNGGYSGANELGLRMDYRSFTDRLIEILSTKPEVELHLIAHVIADGGNDDDWPVAQVLGQSHPGVRVAPKFASASEAKSYMSGLDLVIAGRMHACIGAFSSGVPVIPVAYSRKFNGLFESLGYPMLVDGKALDTAAALERTLDGFARRDELSVHVRRGCEIARARLKDYEDRLVEIIEGSLGRLGKA